jgi:transposase-like protein
MENDFTLIRFEKRFPNNDICLEEITRRRFPGGIVCNNCERITKHYKLNIRPVYTCKFCRTQTAPLTGTLFEKSTTPLRKWFIALYLMTQTRGSISARTLQSEINVTYKTAWRMHKNIYKLMQKNKGDLLTDTHVSKWVIFNTIELKVVRKTE